ncbi:expressed unknown protein [Seminavis robusta]|uniref:PB1 domain-containing protein n=1 Tax=Seminavis robusta TaxID=568900 RepID=A0A9N8DNU9_9STRA|nr:expressed unknown protein [Seminavis robusta]|eukprot:Sro234_g094340.1 n/a (693) ;mRNA; f:14778-16943
MFRERDQTMMMEASTITYSVSSCSDSMIEASKDFVIKLLVEEEGVTTIRRIRLFRIVEQGGKISYDRLVRLVSSKIRYLHIDDVRLSYLDVDDDCVVVDSPDELVDAIDQFNDQRVLRLFVGEVTPSMKQAYYAHGGVGNGHPNKKMTFNGDMQQMIERQIEQVLEKRFRLLEQKRREQEQGARSGPNSANPRDFPTQSAQRVDIGIREEPSPPQQQQQQLHHQASPRRSPQSPSSNNQKPQTQSRHEYSPQRGNEGWYDSDVIRLEDYSSSDGIPAEPLVGEEEFLPNENNPRNLARIRMPWETQEEVVDRRPPRPRKHATPGNEHKRHSFDYPAGDYRGSMEQDEYDLSRINRHRQKHSSRRNHHHHHHHHQSLDNHRLPSMTKRVNIGRDPVQTLDTRFLMNSPKQAKPKEPKSGYRTHPVDHIMPSANDSMTYIDDEDDFHPDEEYDDVDVRDDEEDDRDLDSDLNSLSPRNHHHHHQQHQHHHHHSQNGASMNDDARYLQDWETNTVDSDAELSLLLSDTDFREHLEHRDDTTRGGAMTVASSHMGSVDEEREKVMPPEERTQHHAEDQNQDPTSPPPTSPARPPPSTPLPRPPATPRSPPPSKPPPKSPQQPQSTIQSPLPSTASPPTKANTTPNKTASPSSNSSTPNKANLKPPVGTRSNFNNIPRPTPPAAKKNKLLGILYNSE